MGNAGSSPPWVGARLTPKTPYMCYHAKFGIFVTKGVRINRKEPQKLGALGPRPLWVGAWLTV